jgi:hypothetical protein
MRIMGRWRCQRDMPMLNEDEFARVNDLFRNGVIGDQRYREDTGATLDAAVAQLQAGFEPVRREYERITGMVEANHNAIMHHRISIYGPPCHACGKPPRTPRAKLCAACWARVPGR